MGAPGKYIDLPVNGWQIWKRPIGFYSEHSNWRVSKILLICLARFINKTGYTTILVGSTNNKSVILNRWRKSLQFEGILFLMRGFIPAWREKYVISRFKYYHAWMHCAMKTITIRDDTYHTLLILKEGEDSFSDVINRLVTKKNRDIREYAGALRDSKPK